MPAKKIEGVWAVLLDDSDQNIGVISYAAGEVLKIDVAGADLTGLVLTVALTASGDAVDQYEPASINEYGTAEFRVPDSDIGEWITEGAAVHLNFWTGTEDDDRRRAFGTVKRRVSIRRIGDAPAVPAPVFTTPAALALVSQDALTATYGVTYGIADSGTVTSTLTLGGADVSGDVAGGQIVIDKTDATQDLVVTSTAAWSGADVVSTDSETVPALAAAPSFASPQSVSLSAEETPVDYDVAQHLTGGAGTITYALTSGDANVSLAGSILTIDGEDYSASVVARATDEASRTTDLTLNIDVAAANALLTLADVDYWRESAASPRYSELLVSSDYDLPAGHELRVRKGPEPIVDIEASKPTAANLVVTPGVVWTSPFPDNEGGTVYGVLYLIRLSDDAIIETVTMPSFAISSADRTPAAFSLGPDLLINPGETVLLATVTVQDIDADVAIPAEVTSAEMVVRDAGGQEVSALGDAASYPVELGYEIDVWATGPDEGNVTLVPTLELGDVDTNSLVSSSASVRTRALSVLDEDGFFNIDAEGGSVQYDIDGDGTYEGEVTGTEQTDQIGEAPRFDFAPSRSAAGDTLSILVGWPVWAGANPRLVVEIRDDGNALLQSWDTNSVNIDAAVALTRDISGDTGVLTLNFIASDDNGSTTETLTYDTGAAQGDTSTAGILAGNFAAGTPGTVSTSTAGLEGP